MRHTQDTWSVELPDNWEVEQSEECVIIYHPDGVGAFQVSTFFKEKGDVTSEDLLEFAEVEEPEDVEFTYINGIFKQIPDDDDISFNWWLGAGDQLIFATYICGSGEEDEESQQRESIIQSLKPHQDQSTEF